MELLGFLGAVLGLITAIVNRHRIIELRMTSGQTSAPVKNRVGIRKRMKRCLLCGAGAFLVLLVIGGSGLTSDSGLALPLALGFFGLLFMAAYQLLAIFVLIVAKLWN